MAISINSTKFKNIVFEYLLGSTYDCEYTEPKAIAQYIYNRFNSEYCYPSNLRRYPNKVIRLREWLRGLPLNVEFMNGSIVELYCKWREIDIETLTDRQREYIVDKWFGLLANMLVKLWDAFKIGVKCTD